MHGYVSSGALLLGFETRTSSPVRVCHVAMTPSNIRKSATSTLAVKARATPVASSAPPSTACAARMPHANDPNVAALYERRCP